MQFLEACILPKRPTSRAAVVCKLLVDQLLFAPVSTIMLFAALEAMKGTPEQIPLVIQASSTPCKLFSESFTRLRMARESVKRY